MFAGKGKNLSTYLGKLGRFSRVVPRALQTGAPLCERVPVTICAHPPMTNMTVQLTTSFTLTTSTGTSTSTRALPNFDAICVLSLGTRDRSRLLPDHFAIQQLLCNVVIGLNPCEREDRQLVCFDVDISCKVENEGEYV